MYDVLNYLRGTHRRKAMKHLIKWLSNAKRDKKASEVIVRRQLRAHNGRGHPLGLIALRMPSAHFRAAFFFSLFSFGKAYAGFEEAC